MIDISQAIILGIVEGVTEFLPISSTGHLILASELLRIPQTDFLKSFEIAIQLGAIASVIFLYWRSFLKIETVKKLATALLPTGIIGFILYKTIKNYFLGNEMVVLWALLLGGIALIIFEKFHINQPGATAPKTEISYKDSLLIGLAQAIAVVPGVSRSAATIIGGLLLGIERKTIVEFSFLLAVPTMAAATGFDLFKESASFSGINFVILAIGFVVSFIVALGSIKFLLNFIQNRTFVTFGIYRILIAIIFFLAIT